MIELDEVIAEIITQAVLEELVRKLTAQGNSEAFIEGVLTVLKTSGTDTLTALTEVLKDLTPADEARLTCVLQVSACSGFLKRLQEAGDDS